MTTIAFSPDGREVAYVHEACLVELAVDGKTPFRTIRLHRRAARAGGDESSLTIDTLGVAFAGYAEVPVEVKWSPGGTHIGVLTPQKLLVVDADLQSKELRDGTITSFAWLSDGEIAYCTRRTEGDVQRRVICRQAIDGGQAEDVVAFAQRRADRYSSQERWAPSGQFVIFVEPALGGALQVVNVVDRSKRAIGKTGVCDRGVAWFADSSRAFCVSEGIGGSGVSEAILVEPGTGRTVDCSNEFQEAFRNRSPGLHSISTADNKYVLVNCVVDGGYLVQPEPWGVVPLGRTLCPKLSSSGASAHWPSLVPLPVPGCVGVLATGNEGDSPTKYAADYSGERVLALLETRGRWTVSPKGTIAATVGKGERVEFLDLGKWWISLVQPGETGSSATSVPPVE